MKILGISPLDKDATASFVEDGSIRFAAGEERYSRKKQHAGFPKAAITDGLRYLGWDPTDLDLVVYAFLEAEHEATLMQRHVGEALARTGSADWRKRLAAARKEVDRRRGMSTVPGFGDPNAKMEKSWAKKIAYDVLGSQPWVASAVDRRLGRSWVQRAATDHRHWQAELEAGLSEAGIRAPLKRFEHHVTHLSNAYLSSGFDEALILSLDGYGSGLAGAVATGRNGSIERLHGIKFPNSLGTFYEHVTSALGFKPDRHAGKIVGLAAYGDAERLTPVLMDRFQLTDGDFISTDSFNYYFGRYLSVNFAQIDIAAAYQRALELVAEYLVKYWSERTGCKKVVLSGGVTANVKMNQRIFEVDGIERVFVYPNMGDGGCASGGALYAARESGPIQPFQNAYLGPDFGEAELESALTAEGVDYQRPDDLAATVAALIHKGSVVARFDGRMEYGPRALGNRSVLYHARDPEVNQWLNNRLGRTEFMPFAPVTLWEARHRCYKNIDGIDVAAQFMTITVDCTEEMKASCPAAVHVDGTARPQLIKREMNPGYYDILKAYEAISGIPTLVNTSFNMHEEPIVCSPTDAVKAFIAGELDALAIGPFLATAK